MTPIVVALVSFSVALCLGWILSKAYFRTRPTADHVDRKDHEQMRERYRKRLKIMHKLVKRHEGTQEQIKEMLSEIQHAHRERSQPTDRAATVNLTDTQGELSQLLNNVSERDHEISELKVQITRLESEPKGDTDSNTLETGAPEMDAMLDTVRAELEAVRAELSSREYQAQDLQRKLTDRDTEFQALRAKLDSWKQRVNPLTEKLKQQRATIRALQENSAEQA